MRGDGWLTFTTSKAGNVSVRLFDLSGRVVRTLESRWSEAGQHQLRIEHGLAAGIYLYRVDSPDGSSSGRLVMME